MEFRPGLAMELIFFGTIVRAGPFQVRKRAPSPSLRVKRDAATRKKLIKLSQFFIAWLALLPAYGSARAIVEKWATPLARSMVTSEA